MGLLLTATIRHPELPIFPPDIQSLVPTLATPTALPKPLAVQPRFPHAQYQPPAAFQHASIASPLHTHTPTPTGLTPHPFSSRSRSDTDPAETQLLGEYRTQQPAQPHPHTTIDLADNQYDEDDGYDTDPPAHYPKPGNGVARTLRPESEDLNWLVDDNFEVFSHGWKGDGTGMGADGSLDGMGAVQKVV